MARGISLCLGVTAMIIGSIFPFALGLKATGLNQSILLIVMLGVTGAFIHGAGFHVKGKALGLFISPALTWPIILLGMGTMAALR